MKETDNTTVIDRGGSDTSKKDKKKPKPPKKYKAPMESTGSFII